MPQPFQLKNLYDQGKYEEVISFWFNPLEMETFSQWDFRDVMNSFYKLRRYADCLEVYRACYKRYPDFTYLEDKMGWSIYHTKVKTFSFDDGDVSTLKKQIDFVFAHSTNSQYSPRWVLAKYLVDAINDGKLGYERDYRMICHYLDLVDPSTLDTTESSFTDATGRVRALASSQESWYTEKSKALFKLADFGACIECCDEALKVIRQFHSNNDSWFTYRKAKCLQAIGKADEAKDYILKILDRGFAHWCLYQLLFEHERDAGNTEKCMSYLGFCALSDHEHKMRVSFYVEASDFLESIGESTTAMLHRRLVNLLREENDWKEKSIQTTWQLSDEIQNADKQQILSRLIPFWTQAKDNGREFYIGKIDRLLAEGKSGFIHTDRGYNYYFNVRDIRGAKRTPVIGAQVRFALVNRLDRSKGVVKPNAVDIEIL